MIDALLVPRPFTRVVMLGVFGGLAMLAWRYFDIKFLAYVSGVAATGSAMCLAAVWGMREKLDMLADEEMFDSRRYTRHRKAADALRRRSVKKSAWVGIAALLAASPSISQQLAGAMWEWMVIGCGLGLAEAAYGYLVANGWEEELRAYRAKLIADRKQQEERDALLARIESASAFSHAAPPSGRESGGTLLPH